MTLSSSSLVILILIHATNDGKHGEAVSHVLLALVVPGVLHRKRTENTDFRSRFVILLELVSLEVVIVEAPSELSCGV